MGYSRTRLCWAGAKNSNAQSSYGVPTTDGSCKTLLASMSQQTCHSHDQYRAKNSEVKEEAPLRLHGQKLTELGFKPNTSGLSVTADLLCSTAGFCPLLYGYPGLLAFTKAVTSDYIFYVAKI